jgi:hypothetical protein
MYAQAGLDSAAIIGKVFEVLQQDAGARRTRRA